MKQATITLDVVENGYVIGGHKKTIDLIGSWSGFELGQEFAKAMLEHIDLPEHISGAVRGVLETINNSRYDLDDFHIDAIKAIADRANP